MKCTVAAAQTDINQQCSLNWFLRLRMDFRGKFNLALILVQMRLNWDAACTNGSS